MNKWEETKKLVHVWCPITCKHNEYGNCQIDHKMEMIYKDDGTPVAVCKNREI